MRRALIIVLAVIAVSACKGPEPSPFAVAARAHHGDLSEARPIFNVHDLRASIAYYRDVLGFKVDWEWGQPADFASVSRGHGVLFLCQGCQGTPGAWVMFFTPDVDRMHREFAARKARIRMPPTNMPWGVREMHVADVDGNVMRFGTGIEKE